MFSTNKFITVIALALGMIVAGCSSDDDPIGGNSFEPIVLTPAQSRIMSDMNDFSFGVFKAISDRTDRNTTYSPMSLMSAMSMLANGAEGETLDEILKAMSGHATISDLNGLNSDIAKRLPGMDRRTIVKIGNSLWIDNELLVNNAFSNTIANIYDGELFQTDLKSGNATSEINSWISDKTSGVMSYAIKSPVKGVFTLINTMYFHGEWKTKFDKSLTKKGYFFPEDGSVSSADMMTSYDVKSPYLTGDIMVGTSLPYGNGAFIMTLLMPRDGHTLDECIERIASDAEDAYVESGVIEFLTMPRFEIQSEHNLAKILPDMGISMAFDEKKADLSRISPTAGLFVSDLFQHTGIKVDEDGSEAYTATTVVGGETLGNFIVLDRPFMFFISEQSSRTVLFVGKVCKP